MTRCMLALAGLFVFALPSTCQEPAAPFADLRESAAEETTRRKYLGSEERFGELCDYVWENGDLDRIPGLADYFAAIGSWPETEALRARFRRAALQHSRPGLRRLILADPPVRPYEASTRILALAAEVDDDMLLDHIRSGCGLGTEWVATLLQRVGRDPSRPFVRNVLFDFGVLRARGHRRIAGLRYEGVGAAPIHTRLIPDALRAGEKARVIVGYVYDGAPANARILAGDEVLDEFALDSGPRLDGIFPQRTRLLPAFPPRDADTTLKMEIPEHAFPGFRSFGALIVTDEFLDHRPTGLGIPFVRRGEAAVAIDGAEVASGWHPSIVVVGSDAEVTFEIPEDFDLGKIRSLWIDHWSPALTGWRTELNGAPFVAFTSQPMPRPARVKRLRRGTVKHGKNVLVFRRETGKAPLHLETLWLWP